MYEDEGSAMFGIAKYSIDKWIEAGQPMISTKGLIKLCSNIAGKDLGNLGKVMTMCQKLEARLWPTVGFP
eukprot:6246711-Prorocentrum_lima.AAC.1